MSPVPELAAELAARAFSPGETSSQFSTQWQNPSDVFSVLLILGGDVIQAALAQLSGSRITPIAFSFGWVAYGVTTIISAVGGNKLMPAADCDCKVINAKSGFVRDNVNWVLGRIVRDFDNWRDDCKPDGPIKQRLDSMIAERWESDKEFANKKRNSANGQHVPEPPKPLQTGLCVSIYEADQAKPGWPGYDRLYYLGFITIVVQLGIAAIPLGIHGDYGQILITLAGTVLAFINGGLGQWKKEKWTSRQNSDQTFILTRGNGSQHAIVVIGNGKGLNLEDMSAVPTNIDVWPTKATKLFVTLLGFLWVCLLISASGLGEHTWYLMAIGGLGILENVYVAGSWRTPESFGMPLHFKDVIGDMKVMKTLYAVEEEYPYVGAALVGTFFPGELREDEQTKWDDFKKTAKSRKEAKKLEQKEGQTAAVVSGHH